jgi:hypothetical protein
MKTILMFCLAFVITIGASAQKYSRRPYIYTQPRVHTSISVGIGSPSPYYSPFYRPYPYYGTPIYSRPTRLENEIADIKADYNDRIWSAKHDKSLSKSERKNEIRQLKAERDRAIRDAEYNYHRRRY